MNTTLKVIKLDKEITTCQHCGRENLKRTVLLSDGLYYGTGCAATAIYGKPSASKKVVDIATNIARAQKTVEVLGAVKRDSFQDMRYGAAIAYLERAGVLSREEVKTLYEVAE